MKYQNPISDRNEVTSKLTCIINIPQIESETVNVKVEFQEDDKYATIYVNDKEKYLPETYRIEVKKLLEHDGIEIVIWNAKNSVYDLYQMGLLDHEFKRGE